MNSRSIKSTLILSAAVGLISATQSLAQYRITTDGRLHDANNRIGSNGVNAVGAGASLYNNSLGNQVVTGSVTGGKAFNFGNFSPYSDARNFRGTTANNVSDNFIKNSSGAPFGGVSQNNAQVTQPFYGSRLATAPPPGFAQQAIGSGAFVPSSASLTRAPNDYRLGNVTASDVPLTATPQPGQLLLPGPVDSNTQTVLTASPLYGVRSLTADSLNSQSTMLSNTRTSDVASQIDPTTLQRLRSELTEPATNNNLNTALPSSIQNNNANNNAGTSDLRPSPNQLQSTQLGQPFGTANDQPLDNRVQTLAQAAGTDSNRPLSTMIQPQSGIVRNNLLPPERQSSQFQALSERLKQYQQMQGRSTNTATASNKPKTNNPQQNVNNPGAPGVNTMPGANNGLAGLQNPSSPTPKPSFLQSQGKTPANGNTGVVPPNMGSSPAPSAVATPQRPSEQIGSTNDLGNLPKPVQIHSLAEGVQAKGLADLLKGAEDDAKNGRYRSALEQYDTAEQAAPNNPLIALGRANVELAQSYYGRADQHLKEAFENNPQLLMGQYDLKSLIGTDRLNFLVNDLKENAKNNPTQARPLFLLAYIAYNTGNERAAAGYIDLAQKRAGGDDAVYKLIRQHWSLPPSQPETK